MKKSLFVLSVLLCNLCAFGEKQFPPLVTQKGVEISVSAVFQAIHSDVLLHILRSYETTKRDSRVKVRPQDAFLHSEALFQSMTLLAGTRELFPRAEKGREAPYAFKDTWICDKNFSGVHGITVVHSIWDAQENDFPGYVALRKGDPDILLVVLRGTQGELFQPAGGYLGPSWMTNLSVRKEPISPEIFGFKGKIHHGFLQKVLSYRINLIGSIHKLLVNELKGKTENLIVVVVGHSQGAAVAQITFVDLIHNAGPILFGKDFTNQQNRFYLYILSAPKVAGDKATANSMHAIGIRENMIRHNVMQDPVPNAGVDKIFDGFGEYYPTGYLSLEDSIDVVNKVVRYEVESEEMTPEATLKEIKERQVALKAINATIEKSSFLYLLSKKQDDSLPKKILAKTAAQALMIEAFAQMKKMQSQGFGNPFWYIAAWHYGDRCNPYGSFAFDPRLPSSDLKKGLEKGRTHEQGL